jgi:3-methyladenine DNA glycosylase Mpg
MKILINILIGAIGGGFGGLIYNHGVFGVGVLIGIACGSAGVAIGELIKAERKR